MHELSLVLNILEIADQQMKLHEAHCIESIELEIGALAGVEMGAFLFAWDAAVPKTILASTKRIILEVPARARCLQCQNEYQIEQLYEPCPKCGQYLSDLMQGKELRIKSLEVA